MINITDKVLNVPRGIPGLAPLQIDLTNVYKAESRIPEVAFVTPQKAPELLATFIDAYQSLSKHLVAVDFERSQAERAAGKVRASILLDKLAGILQEKGLATSRSPMGSEDVRQAILDSDPEYTAALDKIDALSAAVELIKGKVKSIEMAYTSVKKIIGEGAYSYRNPNLTVPAERTQNEEESPLPTLGSSVRNSFGKAR
jgi:hypothetical protein